jgi:hypothetical protein
MVGNFLDIIPMSHASDQRMMPVKLRPGNCLRLGLGTVQFLGTGIFNNVLTNRVALRSAFWAWFNKDVRHRFSSDALTAPDDHNASRNQSQRCDRRDLLTGQFSNPLRVIAFNTAEGWARDVSEGIAWEGTRRARATARPI